MEAAAIRAAFLAGLLALAGCSQHAAPDSAAGVIEWSMGGSFSGATGGRLYADDTLVGWSSPPFGTMTEKRSKAQPGTFDKMLAWLRANPLPASASERGPPCTDYGTDLVRYSGPGNTIDYSAGCPDNKVLEYQFRFLEALSVAQK